MTTSSLAKSIVMRLSSVENILLRKSEPILARRRVRWSFARLRATAALGRRCGADVAVRRALRKTPQGKKWHPYQVRELLVAPRNAALRIDGDKEYKGAWPEIVDPAIWRATVDISEDPSRRKGVDRGRKHLLSGLARFGRCGPNSPPRSTIAASANSCITCGKIVRNGDKVDELVIERVVWRLSREDAVDLLRLSVDPVDANALRAERKRLREQLTQLGKDFATAPPEFTKAALDDVNGRLAEIDTKLSDPGKAKVFQGVPAPGRAQHLPRTGPGAPAHHRGRS